MAYWCHLVFPPKSFKDGPSHSVKPLVETAYKVNRRLQTVKIHRDSLGEFMPELSNLFGKWVKDEKEGFGFYSKARHLG